MAIILTGESRVASSIHVRPSKTVVVSSSTVSPPKPWPLLEPRWAWQ